MFTHTLFRSWSSSGASLSKSVSVTGGAEINIDEAVPVAADTLIAFAATVGKVKSLYIVANGDLTLETNSSSAPDNTFNLVANVPFLWVDGDAPIRDTEGDVLANITGLYATNGGDADVTLQIRCLVDPT